MEVLGRFHPLLVHLPIGILVAGIFLYWWYRIRGKEEVKASLPSIFLLGTVSAVLSCLTGLLMANGGEYDELIVNRHRNLGILVAVLSLLLWQVVRKRPDTATSMYISFSTMFVLVATGHYGATLTHGSGFLFSTNGQEQTIKPIANVQEALVYQDIIAPIMQQKCVSCHGAEKQKGKLRLDSEAAIRKGGKNGPVLGSASEQAEIMHRLLLPPEDDDHMPPREKGQLSSGQIALIQWWIRNGASFTARVRELPGQDSVAEALASLSATEEAPAEKVLPDVGQAPADALTLLKTSGAVVVPIADGSRLYSVNLINMDDEEKAWNALVNISPNVLELKADGERISNSNLQAFKGMDHLRRLSLANAQVNDSAMAILGKLTSLESLNLTGTGVTVNIAEALASLKHLKRLYLFNTAVDSAGLAKLEQQLKGVQVEAGRYQVPTWVSDTTWVTSK